MVDRKDSIKKKYNLLGFEGRLGNELQLLNGTNFPCQLSHEDLQSLTVGNLDTYSYSIKDERVRSWLKSLKFGKKVRDLSEI